MNNIPTSEEMEQSGKYEDYGSMMIAFAEMHVKAALEAAATKARIIDDPFCYTGNTGSEYPPDQIVDKDSIINAYPLTLII